ncbi:MAG: hypothetical protein IJ684_00795 [Bacteroidales bacterium]|nr:hypothetical protein [Bacteroidales bacterium]
MKNNDFETQWRQLARQHRESRCPLPDATLDGLVRDASQRPLSPVVPTGATRRLRPLWAAVAAACLLLLAALPALWSRTDDTQLHPTSVNGQTLYFACNNGCSPDATLELLSRQLHQRP